MNASLPTSTAAFTWNTTDVERFTFVGHGFDVRAAKKIIEAAPRDLHTVKVSDLASLAGMIRTKPELVDAADLSVPIIIVTVNKKGEPDAYLPIDGWHRITRAIRDGVETMQAVLLTPAESKKVRFGITDY